MANIPHTCMLFLRKFVAFQESYQEGMGQDKNSPDEHSGDGPGFRPKRDHSNQTACGKFSTHSFS